MKPRLFLLLLAVVFLQGSCKKEESSPYHFSCKINGQKWVPEKYEALTSNKHVLAAGAFYDPSYKWLQIWASRAVVTPSRPEGFMKGGMDINIAEFNGIGEYSLVEYPGAGPGISYLLQNWAMMEIYYSETMYPCSFNAATTNTQTGTCTITKFDTVNKTIEGEFHFDVKHWDCELTASITGGKFLVKYELDNINNQK